MVIILQDEGVWLENGHFLNKILLFGEHRTEYDSHVLIKIIIFVLYPLFDNTSGNLLVVIVKGNEFTCVLRYSQVDICQYTTLIIGRKLVSHFTDGAFNLLKCLFCRFHHSMLKTIQK